MTFEESLSVRSADDYADFLIPHLASDFQMIDVGCGNGAISIGLAQVVRHVMAVDLEAADFSDGRSYAARRGIRNIEFRAGKGAWIEWSQSPLAYAAFAWCRAVGWKSRH